MTAAARPLRVEITREIDCPRDHVWSFFEDFEKVKRWVPGLLELRITSPEPHGEGSSYVMRIREGRRVYEYQGKNLIWDPPHRVREILWGGRLVPDQSMEADYRLIEVGSRTRFEYVNEFTYAVGWRRMLRPLYALGAKAYCRSMIDTLKREAERD